MESTSLKFGTSKRTGPVGSLRTATVATKPTYEELEARIQKLEAEVEKRTQTEEDLQARLEKYKLVFEKAGDNEF